MSRFKYLAYMDVICAVLLDLYSAKPDTSVLVRAGLDVTALLFAVGGLGALAMGVVGIRRRFLFFLYAGIARRARLCRRLPKFQII